MLRHQRIALAMAGYDVPTWARVRRLATVTTADLVIAAKPVSHTYATTPTIQFVLLSQRRGYPCS